MKTIFEKYSKLGVNTSWIEIFKTAKGFKVSKGNNCWNENNYDRYYTQIPTIPTAEEGTMEFKNQFDCFMYELEGNYKKYMYRQVCTYQGHN